MTVETTIKLNEIREGNLVYEFGKVHTISFKDDDQWHLENFEPIPLTPEIIKKVATKYNNDDDRFIIKIGEFSGASGIFFNGTERGDGVYLIQFGSAGIMPPCKYLHQLQNLYFALTQTELNIQL